MEGKFETPLAKCLPDVISPEIQNANFQMIIPRKWKSDSYKPVCIHLAGTGDHVRLRVSDTHFRINSLNHH